jgi:hypothetical protein
MKQSPSQHDNLSDDPVKGLWSGRQTCCNKLQNPFVQQRSKQNSIFGAKWQVAEACFDKRANRRAAAAAAAAATRCSFREFPKFELRALN